MAAANINSTDVTVYRAQQLLPDSIFTPLLHVFNFTSLCMSLFGFISNSLNIIVFYKLGLNTTTNICFYSLAISDLIGLVYVFVRALGLVPGFDKLYVPIHVGDACYALATLSFSCYAFGAWVTAVISMERSCSVVFPMKVKQIFTKQSVTSLLVGMILYQIATGTIRFFSFGLKRIPFPGTNLTTIVMDRSKLNLRLSVLSISLSFSGPTYLSFILVILGTIFLVINLKRSSKRREKMTGKKEEESFSKDARVVKTVILICSVFISGFIVTVAQFVATLVLPNLNFMDPKLGNIDSILLELSFCTQTICCSVNIFIYLRLNSSYKKTFEELFSSSGSVVK